MEEVIKQIKALIEHCKLHKSKCKFFDFKSKRTYNKLIKLYEAKLNNLPAIKAEWDFLTKSL